MKVKKKYIIIITSVIFLLIILLTAIFMLQYYRISIGDSVTIIKSGFSTDRISIENTTDYISENQLDIDVLHYNISLELFPAKKSINGRVLIKGIPKQSPLKIIELNFHDNFKISKLSLNNEQIEYEFEDNRLRLFSPHEIIDTFLINVEYSGKPESMGFGSFEFRELDSLPVIYTLSEPIYASTWFPCNDTPLDKVLSDIIITCDSNLTVVSNGRLENTSLKNDKKTYHWKTNYPIATYLISFAAAEYKNFTDYFKYGDNDSMKISYYVFPSDLDNAKIDFSIHPKAIKFFSDTFGEYPFIKEKYGVVEFLWNYGAIEHQTITGIGKNFISGSQFFTDILVHELAHQWWGNAVTLENWKDIWLNEGFATYSEALYWENEKGTRLLKSTMNSFLTNFDGTTLYNPQNLFNRITYNKGAWVLHMLRREIGDDKFFSLLKTYFEKFKYKNASTLDFENLASEISGKNFNKFFDQWVFTGDGFIELEYSFEEIQTENVNAVKLIINQVQKGYPNYHFPLDLSINLKDGSEISKNVLIQKRENSFSFEFNNKIKKIIFDPNGWLAFKSKRIVK